MLRVVAEHMLLFAVEANTDLCVQGELGSYYYVRGGAG